MSTQVERAIKWAQGKVGKYVYNGMCQAFVADAYYKGAGMTRRSAANAKTAGTLWIKGHSRTDVPTGAAVYFNSPSDPANGHVGLYVGGGWVIHAFRPVRKMQLSEIIRRGYGYRGWGWNGNVIPSGAGKVVNVSSGSGGGSGGGSGSGYSAQEPPEPKAPQHIPQTKKVYTEYEDDNTGKMPDVYRYVWYSLESGEKRDISNRIGSPELEDDSGSICLSFSCTIVQGTTKFTPPLKIDCGDFISVENTASNECVFLGQVQDVSGNFRSDYAVTCQDSGRTLSTNAVIMQFSNIPAQKALSHIANKVGIGQISCPDLVSSVYGVKYESASSIAKSILETVTAENGVPYFIRMVGDTMVVKSYAKDCIRAYHRPAENIHAFDIFDEPGAPSIERSIADLRNKIVVYTSAENAATVNGTAQDDKSIKRYGLRQELESFSDQDGVSASAKAKKILSLKNVVSESFSLHTYGSDKIMAGARFKINLPEISGEFWVEKVRHTYGPPHMVDLTLVRCT